jgi:hypothetical protein
MKEMLVTMFQNPVGIAIGIGIAVAILAFVVRLGLILVALGASVTGAVKVMIEEFHRKRAFIEEKINSTAPVLGHTMADGGKSTEKEEKE